MEAWHLPYEDILSMPVTRRYRLISKKADLERRRAQYHEGRMRK